jgi:hypothetical protein
VRVGGTAVGQLPLVINPLRQGRSVIWADCLPGVTIGLRVFPHGVAWVKRLANAAARRSFTWRIERPSNLAGVIAMPEIVGKDNVLRDVVGARGVTEQRSYPLELTLTEQLVSDNGTTRITNVTETWTGRILKPGGPATDVVYPVEFDPSFTETITAGTEDGSENVGTSDWSDTNHDIGDYYNTQNRHGGLRFVVDDGSGPNSGDTIDSATLTVYHTWHTGSPDFDIYGDDVDNAAAWSDTSRPSQITQTTAKVDFAPTSTSPNVATITTIVQEIVDRAGWTRGNAMRFALLNMVNNEFANYLTMRSFEGGGDKSVLSITYTAGGGASGQPTMKRWGGVPFMRLGGTTFGYGGQW